LLTLNVMILQMVRNEHVRFGGHVDIKVSYKILRLDVLKETQICIIYLALNKGYFKAVLIKNTPRTLGVKLYILSADKVSCSKCFSMQSFKLFSHCNSFRSQMGRLHLPKLSHTLRLQPTFSSYTCTQI
jgi:hypothetical protein